MDPQLACYWTPPAARAYHGRTMRRRFCIAAAVVSMLVGCGNERNGHGAAKTFPRTAGTSVTMGRPGDHWVDTMQFLRVARGKRNNQHGYEVTYEAPGGTTFTLFWSRDQIDLRGAAPRYHLATMPLGSERVLYPDKLTQESLPNVFQAIQLIEDGQARDADGAITAAEMFGVVAAFGGAAPAPRPPGIRVPAPRRVPPARARAPTGRVAGTGITAARAIEILRPGGRLIGEAGSSSAIRILRGGAAEARALFRRLTQGSEIVKRTTYPGQLVRIPGGGKIGLRPVSTSGPPTIDVTIKGLGIREIKFLP